MKKRLLFSGLIIAAFSIGCFQLAERQTPADPGLDRFENKHFPNDHFHLQRAYPDRSVDIQAYSSGLYQARYDAQNRGIGAFPGAWTVQGPGNIGARVNTIAVHPTDPDVIYIGYAGGGVWKTSDGGVNWSPIFDEQPFLAIGDIALDPTDPQIVYVGTGDPNVSGYPAIGDGVYKSTDGGQSWVHLGLAETYITSKIAIDPSDPSTLYVSTMGLPFEPGEDRGLYKSTDGGLNWEQILFPSPQAGICDFLLDPQDPQTIYAAGWDRIRNNFESIVTGPSSRIFKSTDGGQNWIILAGGLPLDDLGRIGLAMSGTNPNVIFAEYVGTNSQLYGIYRTQNGGQNWTQVPTGPSTGLDDGALGGFGWYFAKIRVNPANDNDLFLLGVDLWRTQDGGQTWAPATPPWWTYNVHADKHDLVFGTAGSDYDFLLATDGGLYANYGSQDYAKIENIPTSQFYRVAYNPHEPTNYYGGMQDNGSSGGNAANINDWPRIYGGDGFQMVFHPFDPNLFFVETQNGGISMTTDGGFSYDFVAALPDSPRKNWDMPYLISKHDPSKLYTGTYRAFKGTINLSFNNVFWDTISQDLTKGVLTEPRYHVVSTLHESPIVPGLLYYGSSDGRVTRTDNDGGNWTDISAGLPDRYVTDIKTSPSFADYVYVTHSGYKWGEYIPRVHRSTDRGATWEDISGDLPDLAINDVYIHPMHQDSIIFVGTDGGVYGTVDAGQTWERVGNDMPFVPVYDLELNLWQNTLVAGTHARSIMTWPLDSLVLPEVEDTTVAAIDLPVSGRELLIYPSPAVTTSWVEFDATTGRYRLSVADGSGRTLLSQNGEAQGRTKVELNLAGLPSGWYAVKLEIDGKVKSGKLVKR